jgi:hypothetical protein
MNIPQTIEPKKTNRWIIKPSGVDIPEYTFSKYKLYNDGNKLIFETSCYETIIDHINPVKLFSLHGLTLQYLDPVGEIIGGFSFDVKSLNFSSSGSYKDDELLTYNFVIEVNTKSFKMLFIDNEKNPQ